MKCGEEPNYDTIVPRHGGRLTPSHGPTSISQVYFADNTRLDTSRSMGFKNLDLYCVAPIVNGNSALESYDFWAIGLNCCSGVSSDFRCGEWNNPHARSGLRLMRDDQRPFFRLAVQQAAAAHKLKVGWRLNRLE